MLLRCLCWFTIMFRVAVMVLIIFWGETMATRAGLAIPATVIVTGLDQLTYWVTGRAAAAAQRAECLEQYASRAAAPHSPAGHRYNY